MESNSEEQLASVPAPANQVTSEQHTPSQPKADENLTSDATSMRKASDTNPRQ